MRRAKLGDLYCIKLSNGYKLYQWAYRIPRKGDFIRVFDGLYDSIPENLQEIVNSPHSYIISFYASRAYRIGLVDFLGNFPVPEEYPFPEYQIAFYRSSETGKIDTINVMNSDLRQRVNETFFGITRIEDLPEPFCNTTLLNSYLTPNWLFYLFDNGFDLQHPERKYFDGDAEMVLQKYTDMVETALENERRQKLLKKQKQTN